MNCFFYFKDKSRGREQRSAPELKEQRKSDYSGADRVSKSSCSASSPRGIPQLYEEKAHGLRVFSYSELRQATNDFNRLLKIGEGGFGNVYKGSIKPAEGKGDPIVVAIKKRNEDGLQGHKQWVAEVQFLGVVEHPNLVKLIGYCATDGRRGIQRLLVYEYMANKSLEDHLFNKARAALSWKTRLQIVLGAAQGLAYLHEGLEVQVIFRDFKTSNVLLDENFEPKLSDFGLAREGPMAGQSHVSTAICLNLMIIHTPTSARYLVQRCHLPLPPKFWRKSAAMSMTAHATGFATFSRQMQLTYSRLYRINKNKFFFYIQKNLHE
ncbi:hypothetical protein I3760_13G021100 [Carya illinoinensis]|nr:hypothetical protein I3760_13G021100 [Carya illinoinensis]